MITHGITRGWQFGIAIQKYMSDGVYVWIDTSGGVPEPVLNIIKTELAYHVDGFDQTDIKSFTIGCFDTDCHNVINFNEDNFHEFEYYKLRGGGGTDLNCIISHMREVYGTNRKLRKNRVIIITDGQFIIPDELKTLKDVVIIEHDNNLAVMT